MPAAALAPPHALAAGGAGLAVWLAVGGLWGALSGVAAGWAARRWLRGQAAGDERRRGSRLAADLPAAVDLLAACLAAGSQPADAADEVARAVGGPIAEALRGVVAELRLGGDPAGCWRRLAVEPALAPLGRALARCASSGAPIADGVSRLADDLWQRRRFAARDAVRRVGVQATAPLGLCFLPAFVLIGVAPVVIGLAEAVTR